VLNEAEAARELALLMQGWGVTRYALTLLNTAHRLFAGSTRASISSTSRRVSALEDDVLRRRARMGAVDRIADSYTFGHCERVAQRALAVARGLVLG